MDQAGTCGDLGELLAGVQVFPLCGWSGMVWLVSIIPLPCTGLGVCRVGASSWSGWLGFWFPEDGDRQETLWDGVIKVG